MEHYVFALRYEYIVHALHTKTGGITRYSAIPSLYV